MKTPDLQSYAVVEPHIYAYQTPGVLKHEGWTKIGEARTQTVETRIKQQTSTPGLDWNLSWARPAWFDNGQTMRDKAFHRYLVTQGIPQERDATTKKKREWFQVEPDVALSHFETFAHDGEGPNPEQQEYWLRREQALAVAQTKAHFEAGGEKFLWNAKPRFGKTLAAYDLVRQMGLRKVLILTNRPAVADGWVRDFARFIGWQTGLLFVSENKALKSQFPKQVLLWQDYQNRLMTMDEEPYGFIAFESLQGLKGSRYFDGDHDKLKWMAELEWDLLIIDEAHEGVETERTDIAIDQLRHKHRLHLSGTPFKQLARGDFLPEETFTWSYVDEQEAKAAWTGEENNPYEHLPSLKMFTYRLSEMTEAEVRRGYNEDIPYAFDLMEFFKTRANGTFVYEEKVRNFLRALTTQEKYPFSTPELREELRHTIWVLNRVASVKALEKLLKEEGSPFADYEVVIAAGDGRSGDEADEDDRPISLNALGRVRNAIASGKPTITLSVGQLTVGVTVPEWTGILMLTECKSPAAYVQATFRVQNPREFERDHRLYIKREAYVFDFNPTRTLILFEQLANETVPVLETEGESPVERREKKIRKLLNFYPVIGEDEGGQMVPLDVAKVLSIPCKLKCQEVVRHGFMSNLLLCNINRIFSNLKIYEGIINAMTGAKDFAGKKKPMEDLELTEHTLDDEGNVVVPEEKVLGTAKDLFGEKIYGVEIALPETRVGEEDMTTAKFMEAMIAQVKTEIVDKATQDLKPAARNAIERTVKREMEGIETAIAHECKLAVAEATLKHATALEATSDEAEREDLERRHQEEVAAIKADYGEKMVTATQQYVQTLPVEVTRQALTAQEEAVKKADEDAMHERLRGFARAIPSFIMAYGDKQLRLANFDQYVEEDVFQDVTGITLEAFRFRRDGGDYAGCHAEGGIFNEQIFDESIQEFLRKKEALADYFDKAHDEDIFDYIPPQRTNQIFTPRDVVSQMLETLEAENPGCFDDPDKTFADLYVKSGLYLAEIAKRLYHSPAIQKAFPDDQARLEHIFTKQLYAMAPTKIIHRIAVAYLLDFNPALREKAKAHIVCADAAAAAQSGTLDKLVEESFG